MVNLSNPGLLLPFELKRTLNVDQDSYVTSISFHGSNNVGIVWLNRPQNAYVLVTCTHMKKYNCTEVSVYCHSHFEYLRLVAFSDGSSQEYPSPRLL